MYPKSQSLPVRQANFGIDRQLCDLYYTTLHYSSKTMSFLLRPT